MNKQTPIEPASAIAALAKAQSEMGAALKKTNNPHFNRKYADLSSVQDACFDALHNNGFAVVQPSGRDESGMFVDTLFLHTSGETFQSRVYLVVDKNNMQGVGSAITYARRYGLMGLAGIAPEDDDGNAAAAAAPRLDKKKAEDTPPPEAKPVLAPSILDSIAKAADADALKTIWDNNADSQDVPEFRDAINKRKKALPKPDEPKADPKTLVDDEIPF